MDVASGNVAKIAALFPQCVTECKDVDGVRYKIDFDKLRSELGDDIFGEGEERYQFTWPDKRTASHKANERTTMTLRPCREESVDFDNTQNLYIEGDNLDVLKVLRETYLGKVKMIYIDPPYNTGNDFVYNDDFAQDYAGARRDIALRCFDEAGNQIEDFRMVRNTESNGRFHTDWLNMIYPRLKVARDLLAEDGVIFISIDDGELENLRRLCDEIFGISNFRNTILVRRRIKSLNSQFADNGLQSMNVAFEYVLAYSKSDKFLMKAIRQKKVDASPLGRWDVFWSNADRPTMRYELLGFTPETGQWRNSKEKALTAVANYQKFIDEYSSQMSIEEYSKKFGITDFIRRIPNGTGKNGGVQHWVAPSDTALRTSNWTDIEVSQISKEIDLPFDNPKSRQLISELIKLSEFTSTDIILDFFSGSATTAHAVMKLNAEDGGHRKFIMVQLPEVTNEKSEARKAGYNTICEIGKERIRRAGRQIRRDMPAARFESNGDVFENPDITCQRHVPTLDTGFRVLKLDSSNMEDVYYTPENFDPNNLFAAVDNVKSDRTPEDLLFQVIPELNIELSAKIEQRDINGNKVFFIDGSYLIATFDIGVNESTITEIAKMQPRYFVMRDASAASDNVLDNFEQIFNLYSPDTFCKIL
ncbi:MAG: site-specific DNA-methyltransferase [Candidatus Amulumruptor caecigallinarius]|nr:site-specific DNA-methyltransferase [Candidatus Amulumruptor caecigallinarius]MCM1395880.1 site-specific DNA-methyltransferase [Candidatus Amulumruptor caecigallinarius]MCM1452915.1 site-specific DNA-methyltransferase [bacterium]